MVQNIQLENILVYCKNCIHRSTKVCPRYIEVGIDRDNYDYIDTTNEYGYCEKGEGEVEY